MIHILSYRFSYNKKTTFISPAAGFYMQNSQGIQEARFAYVLNRSEIEEAIEVLAVGLEQYPLKQLETGNP